VPISMSCPSCGKTLSAPDASAGKKAKCPSCGQIMIVPSVVQPPADQFGYGAPQPPSPYGQQPTPEPTGNWLDDVQGPAPTPGGPGGDARRPCPECGEMIVAGAAKCRFCNAIFDPRLRLKAKRDRSGGDEDENPSALEWIICGLPGCLLIGCIAGIVYAIQGKPKGMKMVGISFAAMVIWNILGFIVSSMK
jgi:predicted RNA-binding Zn-ribbon protein involved in translation (DUF1610 family)